MSQSPPTPEGKRNLSRKGALNFITTLVEHGSGMAVNFFLNPQILGYLGPIAYGIWKMMDRLIGYLATPGGRPSQALNLMLSNRQHTSDDEAKRRMVGSAIMVWLLFSPICILGGAVLVVFLPRWVDMPPEMVHTVRWAMGILAFSVLLKELIQIPYSTLVGMNMKYKLMGAKLGSYVVIFVASILMLRADWDLPGLATAHVLSALFVGLFSLIVARRALPWFTARRPSWQEVREFLQFNGWFLVWRILDVILVTSDVLLVGFVIDAATVTTYTITNFAATLLFTLSTNITGAILPGLGGLLGEGKYKRVFAIRGEVLAIVWVFVMGVGCATLITNHAFVSLWMGAEYDGGRTWTLLMVLCALQMALVKVDSGIIDVNLDLRQKVRLVSITVVATLGLGLLGLHLYGIPGMLVGYFLGRLVQGLGFPYLAGLYLKQPLDIQVTGAVRPTLVTILVFGGIYLFVPSLPTSNWIVFFAAGAAITVVAAPLCFLLGLDGKMRGKTKDRILGLVKRRKG